MELSEIQAFVAVGESGSVNRAAHRLRLSQPAVTRRVQRLEATLGVTLLDRRAKPPSLTPAGQLALEHCRNVLKAVAELHAATTGEGPTGEFRLGVPHSLADVALAEPADHLRQVFPRMTFRLSTGWSQDLLGQLREGALDIAIVQLPDGAHPPSGLEGRMITTYPLLFVAPRRRRLRSVVNLADVADENWVLNPDGCGFRAALRRALQEIHAPLRIAVEAYGFDLQLSLVARGAGLGLVPPRVRRRSRVRSQIRTFRIRGLDFRIAVWIVHGRLPAAVAPVVTALDEQFARVFQTAR